MLSGQRPSELRPVGPSARSDCSRARISAGGNDSHPLVREESVYYLGKIGPEAAAAIPALTQVLNDPSEEVRTGAANTLEKIGTPEAKAALAKKPKSKILKKPRSR